MNKKGFTLIELLAVIVILAIIALIAVPIILNKIRDAREEANETNVELHAPAVKNERSVELYATAVKNAIMKKKIDEPKVEIKGSYTQTKQGRTLIGPTILDVEYDGDIQCEVIEVLDSYKLKLTNCKVPGSNNSYSYDEENEGTLTSPSEPGGETPTDPTPEEPGDEEDDNDSDVFDASALTYIDMEVVYYDVGNGIAGCTNYHEDNSKTGYNGMNPTGNQTNCLKFYKYAEDATTKTMILDHNTTATVAWYPTGTNQYGPSTASGYVLDRLKSDTASWQGTIEPSNYLMDQTGQTSNTKYTIDYSGYKARLITAQEITYITGNTGWDETSTSSNWYYFHDFSQNIYAGRGDVCASSGCTYGWLYDRTTIGCESYGCLNDSDVETYGYWTASSYASNSNGAWYVYYDGDVRSNLVSYSGSGGVRPVITISKS